VRSAAGESEKGAAARIDTVRGMVKSRWRRRPSPSCARWADPLYDTPSKRDCNEILLGILGYGQSPSRQERRASSAAKWRCCPRSSRHRSRSRRPAGSRPR
jgi:hypothetical protein